MSTQKAFAYQGDLVVLNGKVVSKSNGDGVGGLEIHAYDRDIFSKDDLLNSIVTDTRGLFTIIAHKSKFYDRGVDKKPDLFVQVYEGERKLFESKFDADDLETQELLVIEVETMRHHGHEAVHREGSSRVVWARTADASIGDHSHAVLSLKAISLEDAQSIALTKPDITHFQMTHEGNKDLSQGDVSFFSGTPKHSESRPGQSDIYEKMIAIWHPLHADLAVHAEYSAEAIDSQENTNKEKAFEHAFENEEIHFIHLADGTATFYANLPDASKLNGGTIYRRDLERFY
jgi:hypothetical protein